MRALADAKRWQHRTRRGRWRATEALKACGRPAPLVVVPDEVWAELAARQHVQPSSLTALICGDPLPGYSALDRR